MLSLKTIKNHNAHAVAKICLPCNHYYELSHQIQTQTPNHTVSASHGDL